MPKEGLSYARTDSGLTLPVIDVTHPAFKIELSAEQQKQLMAEYVKNGQPLGWLPLFIRKPLLNFLLKKSVLGQRLRRAEGTYLDAESTYLLKLGPDNLEGVSNEEIDKKVAAALPTFMVRLRTQDLAELMAESLGPALAGEPGVPLSMISIGGGPAIDCLNAVRLLQKDRPEVLRGRAVIIEVLDLDSAGPAFGARCVAEWLKPGAPLHGVDVTFNHTKYDWSRTEPLREVLERAQQSGAVAIVSSEGALFEYGSDAEIVSNLECVRASSEPGMVRVVGSVTRNDEATKVLHDGTSAKTKPRGLATFTALAERAGWKVEKAVERAFSDQVRLK
ncbi:MAG: hypothetical protein QM723_05710 [Myxococcaceae bacterium]